MPIPTQMNVQLTAAQVTTITTNLNSIINIFNTLKPVNLTNTERQRVNSISGTRQPYADVTIQTLAPGNTSMQPPFKSLTEATTDFNYAAQLRPIIILITQLLEIVTDHSLSSENLVYDYLLEFYNIAKRAEALNVPGADTVVAQIAPLFEQQNGSTPPPPTP